MEEKRNRRGKLLRTLLATAGAALALLLFAYGTWEKPPETARAPLPAATAERKPAPAPGKTAEREISAAAETEKPEELPAGEAIDTARKDGVYTVLLAGSDDGNGNTDAILLGRIDTKKHLMDFVSIPRDTLINVDWGVRRINAAYWGARNAGGNGLEALKTQVARLTGFPPDCCAVVDLQVFMDAVDLIGGIRFDVPMAMDYEDAGQELYIHLQPGPQVLDGYQAMCLCRYRSGYITADLGRIDMQQRFLAACTSQLLDLGSIPKAPELLKLLEDGLDTDLSPANMAFLLRQFLACKPEDIRFHQAACDSMTIRGCSYVLLQPGPWLELVNEYLNPFASPVTRQNVELIYRSGDGVGCTGTLRDPGYYRPAQSVRSDPAPAPTVGPTPAPTPDPTPAPTEKPGDENPLAPFFPDAEPSPAPGEGGGPVIITVRP